MTLHSAQRHMGKGEFIALLSLLMGLTGLAVDMMLPAFADMRSSFGLAADSSETAAVVTAFFIGFGCALPLWGPLSDGLGRKRVLRVGLAVYIGAALAAALAPTLGALLVVRFVGGVGAAAPRVVAQGLIRDRYSGDQMAKVLSYVIAIFILVPVFAPSVGAAVLLAGSWRWIFLLLVIAGSIALAWSVRLPETLPVERRIPLSRTKMLEAFRAVASSRFAMGFTVVQTMAFGFLLAYLASSELIIEDIYGLGAWFPIIFGVSSLVFLVGILVNPRLIDRSGLRRTLRFSTLAFVVTTAVFAVIAIATAGEPPFWLFMLGILPILTCHVFVVPNVNSAAMMPMGRIAGMAAAVIGAIATLGAAAVGAVINSLWDGTVLPLALAGVVVSTLAFLAYRWSDAAWDRSADRQLLAPEGLAPEQLLSPGEGV